MQRLMFPIKEWTEVDSNHRSNLQQIYSLSPLATREPVHDQIDSDNFRLYNIFHTNASPFFTK